jgi:c-di-GMP-binding flagellar brake protein YcgR
MYGFAPRALRALQARGRARLAGICVLMNLKSLVLCSDEKIVRILRRTLGDLEIDADLCADADAALRKLTRLRFEAIIVDCAGSGSSEVLRSARNAPCNKQAIAVAIVEPSVGLRPAFDLGAHFVLYKPLSSERAKSSFRAARALMKRERRRNARVAVQMPVVIRNNEAGANMKVTTVDFSEGGMAVSVPQKRRPTGTWQVAFTLPGTNKEMELAAEFAWEGNSAQAGLRFVQVAPDATRALQQWLQQNSPEIEQDDPPVRCQLTDLSLGGCYLEIASPYPLSTRVTLSMRAGGTEVRAEGVVRVMYPEKGMGVEFTQGTSQHRQAVEQFLLVLTENRSLLPELLVQPEGLDAENVASAGLAPGDDPLLQLFRGEPMAAEAFHEALQKQRNSAPLAAAAGA